MILVFAPMDRIVRVSLRQEALEVPPQDIITRDNVTLKVNAVIFLRVIDPNKAVVEVSNYVYQTSQFAQTTLRSVLGEQEMDELLAHREKINLRLQSILDTHTAPWGVKVTNVEVKQVDMPEAMLRAMAKQAEAEREKRSKIIHAEGEFAAAQRLVDAAHLLASEPVSVQLRYLQTLTEIGVEKNTTVIFPVPVDFFSGLQKLLGKRRERRRRRLRREARGRARERAGSGTMASSQDTEITLGTGKLLVLFFGLVGICALFFALGIRWGASRNRRSQRRARPFGPQTVPGGSKANSGSATTPPMTFYKAVEQKDANPQLTPAADAKADTATGACEHSGASRAERLPIRRQPCPLAHHISCKWPL